MVGYIMSKIEIVRDILAEVGQEQDMNDEPLLNECMDRLRIKIKGKKPKTSGESIEPKNFYNEKEFFEGCRYLITPGLAMI